MNNEETVQPEPEKSKPDESCSFHVEGFLKISDPDTGEIILATRD